MTTLHETTRKLMSLGCPEHPRLRHHGAFHTWSIKHSGANRLGPTGPLDEPDAAAIWRDHAAEWAVREKNCIVRRFSDGWMISRFMTTGAPPKHWQGIDLLAGLVEILEEANDAKDTE